MAPANVGLASLHLVLLGPSFAHFELKQPCAQHIHRLIFVAMLASIVLTLNHNIGRQVGYANRRFGFVNMLTACARGSKNIDPQIGRIDIDLN